jgi:hypothetical protein
MVLDRSGSMGCIQDSTIEGINEFLRGQKDLEGTCKFTLHQFDTEHMKTYLAEDISEVPYLDRDTFQPRGMTALCDAIGFCIQETKERIEEMHEFYRPDAVMFVIVTDGHENSSKEYTRDSINTLITAQTDEAKWDFVFLAANQDAIQTGADFGILAGKSMTFNASDAGMGNTMSSVNAYYSNVRSGNIAVSDSCFSAQDREDAVK